MRRLIICIYAIIAIASICYGQDSSQVIDKYKNLQDRNYRDISKEIKTDIDSLLVNNIENYKEKRIYLKDFHKRLKGINAILIPNEGITDSIERDFSKLIGYKEYQLCDTTFANDAYWAVFSGPLEDGMIFDRAQYYVNDEWTSFVMIIEKYNVTYLVNLEGTFKEQDIERIVHSIEYIIKGEHPFLEDLSE